MIIESSLGFNADWDQSNSWSKYTGAGIHSENQGTWESSPIVPYLGGAGRIRTTYSVQQVTSKNWGYVILGGAGQNGTLHSTIAMRIQKLQVAAARPGPLVFSGELDDDSTLTGHELFLESLPTHANGDPVIRLATSSGATSHSLDLSTFKNTWLIFDIRSYRYASVGGGLYDHVSSCDVYAVYGSTPTFLAHLEPGQVSGTNPWRTSMVHWTNSQIGFVGTDETQDSYDFYVDEHNYQTGGEASFPRSRSGTRGFDPYATISKWDPVSSTWVSEMMLKDSMISEMTCDFLPHRVEKSASVKVVAPKHTNPASEDFIERVRLIRTGPLYRLSIMSPDENAVDPTVPAGWVGPPILWSGIINSVDISESDGSVSFSAIGFSKHLSQHVVTHRDFERKTPEHILGSIGDAAFLAAWPGTIALDLDTQSAAKWFLVNRMTFQTSTVGEVVRALRKLGTFDGGVSVSGYPYHSSTEFRFSFRESKADNNDNIPGPSVAGLGEGVGAVFDLNDPRITLFSERYDDSDFVNRWTVLGEVAHAEIRGVVSQWDNNTIRDLFAVFTSDAEIPLPEGSLSGWSLILRDRVFRQDDRYSGYRQEVIPGKTIGPIPGSLTQAPPGQAAGTQGVYTITSFSPSLASGWIDFGFHRLPAPKPHLPSSFQTDSDAVRYELRNNGNRVIRTIEDSESIAGREVVPRSVDDRSVRGWLLATSLAMQSHWNERRQSRRVRMRVEGIRTWPNGVLDPSVNRIMILDGNVTPTRIGAAVSRGSAWTWGDDERPVGMGNVLEIREVRMTLRNGAWDAVYTLGVNPRDVDEVVIPQEIIGNSPFARR